jgi:hypothetical protein
MSRIGTRPSAETGLRRPMPFRHKLMLLLAVELVAVGFQQAERKPYRPGIAVEMPAQSGHIIT